MATYHGGRRAYGNGRPERATIRPRTKVPPHVLRELGTPRKAHHRGYVRALLLLFLVVALLVPATGAAAGGYFYATTAASLRPRLDKLASFHASAFQTSRVYDRNGTLLYEFVNAGRRDPVRLDQIADVLKEATIAIEDKTFYENVGVDYLGIARAAYSNFVSGREVSGASTITQQLIKNIVLSEEETRHENRYRRKVTEIILAQQIGSDYSKDEILELYLNEINYGNLAYGIQAAAKSYFGRDASELNLNQASLLAGLPQSPTYYNPIQFLVDGKTLKGVTLKKNVWLNPQARLPYGITPPRARQVDVLRQMVLTGKVAQSEAVDAVAEDLEFVKQEVPLRAPHFVFHVKEMLEKDPIIRDVLVNQGGLTITTTLDLRIQDIAQREAAKRIEELEKENRNIHNAAVVVEQPRTGQILAMVGSVDYNRTKATNTPGEEGNVLDGNVNVTTRERQPGSALKPFTYLSGLAQGKLNPGSVLWDVETKFPVKLGASKKNLKDDEFWYGPKNFSQKWYGPLRMRESLANSLNMPAVKALKRSGIAETIDLLHRVGISPDSLDRSPEHYGLALTLGGGEVTPLDLTTAYNTLANDGEFVPATPILKITDRAGNELPYSAGQRRQAVDPKYVAIVRDFMGDNEARVPLFGRENPLNPSRRAHAKTGTTEDFRDAWAVGYTPYVTVGVWTGNNNNEKTAKVESTVGGGIIWNRIMEALFANPELDNFLRDNGRIPLEFPDPKTFGLEERRMCQLGGRMGQRTKEWFVPGQNNGGKIDCDLTKLVTVAYDKTGMCLVPPGVKWNARQFKAQVSSLPPATDEEMIVNTASENGGISGGRAPERVCGGGDLANALAIYGVTNAPIATPAQAPAIATPAQAPAIAQPNPNDSQSSDDEQVPAVQEPAAPVRQAPTRAPRQVAAPVPTAARSVQQPRAQPRPTEQPPVRQPPTQQPVRQAPVEQAPPAPKPAPTKAPAGPSMPSLVGLGENQAKGVLANLGVTSVVVDYQGRDQLGALYDKFPAYAVVSHSPAPGTPIKRGMTVILGIRGP